RLHPEPEFLVHPETAAAYGIADGDWCTISNNLGSARLRAHTTVRIRKDTVSADHGWWFPEQEAAEPNLYGVFDCNGNNLTTMGVYGPTHYGAPYKSTLCK
ncbi:molybdopterin dinucleotide binding domain-containing protein, partial [Robertmurraya sp. DFI.2.37]|uniref:molybdopterin dinucleotide binding domain-containing protein n=1 Tax=Robertmurraya sp. DFI.2.37 TaxID=3031819 RepID=UPI0023DB1430